MSRTNLRIKVADNIKKARLSLELTQEKAAEKIGFHYKYYQRVESGIVNLTLDSLQKISKAFRILPKSLLD